MPIYRHKKKKHCTLKYLLTECDEKILERDSPKSLEIFEKKKEANLSPSTCYVTKYFLLNLPTFQAFQTVRYDRELKQSKIKLPLKGKRTSQPLRHTSSNEILNSLWNFPRNLLKTPTWTKQSKTTLKITYSAVRLTRCNTHQHAYTRIACVQVGRWVMISSIYTTVCHGSSALGYSWQFSLATSFSLSRPLVRSISPSLFLPSSHSPFIFPSLSIRPSVFDDPSKREEEARFAPLDISAHILSYTFLSLSSNQRGETFFSSAAGSCMLVRASFLLLASQLPPPPPSIAF